MLGDKQAQAQQVQHTPQIDKGQEVSIDEIMF